MARLTHLTLTLTAALSFAGAAVADGHFTPEQQRAVGARQAHMTLLGFNMGPLGGMAQERIPYDAKVAQTAATNLAALASLSHDRYWVEGTDDAMGGTRAKPEIWTDAEGFAAKVAALSETTAALAMVAGDGLDAMRGAFGPVGQSCGSCHESYRTPQN